MTRLCLNKAKTRWSVTTVKQLAVSVMNAPGHYRNVTLSPVPNSWAFTTHLIQRPCYQRGSPCHDPAGSRTHEDRLTIGKRCKLMWYGHVCRSSGLAKNHLARRSERGRKTGQTEEEMGRQHQEIDRPGDRQVPEGSGEQGKWKKLVVKSSKVPQRHSRLRDG